MFYVVTYAGSGLVTVGVGLLATLFGLTASVRWFAAVLAAACLLMLVVLQRHPARTPRRTRLIPQEYTCGVTSSLRFSDDGKSLRHFELQPFDIRLTPEIIADSIDPLIAQPLPQEGTAMLATCLEALGRSFSASAYH